MNIVSILNILYYLSIKSFLIKLSKKQKTNFKSILKKNSFFKIRELNIKKYDICEYIVIFIYIFNNNNKIILIRREIYIVDVFSIKIFININIIKSKTIILNIVKIFIIIELCVLF